MANPEITTIKLLKETKERLDHLRSHKRETYEDILQRMLEILNVCRVNPDLARSRLLSVERRIKAENRRQIPRRII